MKHITVNTYRKDKYYPNVVKAVGKILTRADVVAPSDILIEMGNLSKHRLVMESIHIEQDLIKETVGSQDQTNAAYGGFNKIRFNQNGKITVNPITISYERIQALDENLMLFYTGIIRTAEKVAKSYVDIIEKKEKQLLRMHDMVDEAIELIANGNLDDFGRLLKEEADDKIPCILEPELTGKAFR